MIYPLDSAIRRLKNRSQDFEVTNPSYVTSVITDKLMPAIFDVTQGEIRVQSPGAPNDRMFPNTPETWKWRPGTLEGSQMVFSVFSSHPKVLATLMGPVQTTKTSISLAFIGKFEGTFCLYTESFSRPFFNNNRNILVLKCDWHNLRKS